MEKNFLIKYKDCYADEFDLCGHMVLNEERYETFMKNIGLVTPEEPVNFNFGTNEKIIYYSKEQIESCLEIYELSEEDYEVLARLEILSVGIMPSEDTFI